MLTIPDSIAELAKSVSGENKPTSFLDIYADTGPQDSVDSASQWEAPNDPATVNDTNVDYNRKPGSMVLAAGAYVAPAAIGTNVLATTLNVTIKRTDKYHYAGTINKLLGSSYKYESTSYVVTINESIAYQSFRATSTQIIDDVIVASRYIGYQAMPVTVSIVNAATGNQVGAAVTYTPTGTTTRTTLSGFAAGVLAGVQYRLVFTATVPTTIGTIGGPPTTTKTYSLGVELYGYDVVSTTWRLPFGSGTYLALGGRPNYTTTGNFQRTLDVGSVPTDPGTVTFSDIVPSGTSMQIACYYTDSAVVAAEAALTNWTLLTEAIVSGAGLSSHRYWRFDVTMNSNTAQDQSPELLSILVRFAPDPVILGTTARRYRQTLYDGFQLPVVLPISWTSSSRMLQQGFKALNTVSASSAELSPQFNGSMIGNISATLLTEPIVDSLLTYPLRGKRVDYRIGYEGIDDTIRIYSGAVEDMTYANRQWTMSIADNFQLADVSIPSDKAGAEWAVSTSYSLNDIVVHGSNSYICILAHTSSASDEPGVGVNWTTYWADNGTVWATIVYDSTTSGGGDWHLADIITDILANHINIPNERIDFAAIAAVKAALPNRTGERLITKPTKATELLGELAWLLDSQFVVRDGLFSLVREPDAGDEPVENITGADVLTNSLRFRRGWRDLLNLGVIVSGYSGDGEGSDKFSIGEVLADATSIADYGTIVQKTWQDKWSVPATELSDRLQSLLDRYSDGRRAVQCQTTMRLLAVEPGDVVSFSSAQLPSTDPGPLRMMVIRKQLDWQRQSITLGLLEVF